MTLTIDSLNKYYWCTCADKGEVMEDQYSHDFKCDLWDCEEWLNDDVEWDNVQGILRPTTRKVEEAELLESLHDESYTDWWEAMEAAAHTAPVAKSSPALVTPTTGFAKWKSCTHSHTEVVYPNSTVVYAQAVRDKRRLEMDYGLWLDSSQMSGARHIGYALPWRDYGLPSVPDATADDLIEEVFELAKAGFAIEVGCYGAHGRTGVVLACWAILAGVPKEDACEWVWDNYCHEAIENDEQEWWVMRFGCVRDGTPVPPMPEPPPPPKLVTKVSATPVAATKPASAGASANANSKQKGSKKWGRKGRK